MNKAQRIQKIISELSKDLHEREEIVSVAFLAAVAGQNTFLLGPPGTAKSLISRRISCAFESASYFECLMNRFTTPEEIFGPVSIKALKEDNYTRKTEGYMPSVDFAFLDEIWKSSPAILNALLTLINERIFRNGSATDQAPLKALITASNETPLENQGLEAIYDRFLTRLFVAPLSSKNNFEALINSKPTSASITLSEDISIKNDEWDNWQSEIHTVCLSTETITVINLIRQKLNSLDKNTAVYVSDRRWQKAAYLIKASAFLCDRKLTNLSDTLLLRHCLWTTEENRQRVIQIVEDAVCSSGIDTGVDIDELDKEKERLDRDIHEEFYYTDDIYKTVKLGDEYYFHVKQTKNHRYDEDDAFFIPMVLMGTQGEFHPTDRQGNEIRRITCTFDGQDTCNINDRRGYSYTEYTYTPRVLFHKGDKKNDIRNRVLKAFSSDVTELKKKLTQALNSASSQKSKIEKQLEIPFVPEDIRELAYKSISEQIRSLKTRIMDCDLMQEKIGAELTLEKAS